MSMNVKGVIAAAVLVCAPALAAQQQVAGPSKIVRTSASIEQIESSSRRVTLKNQDGSYDSIVAGPEFQRFSELKVGDRVNVTYYESTVYALRKPGEPPLNTSGDAALTSSQRALPGGTAAIQTRQTVTVKAIDMNVPSITVTTADGRTVSRKVEVKSRLDGVKVGDQIDIIFTEAMLLSVDRAR